MKWVNHQVLTGVIVYAATDDMLLTIYSMAGAIFPDKVEGSPRAGNYWSWRSRHRGWSHWPMLYLGLIFFLSRLEEGQLIADAPTLAGIPGVIVQGRYDVVCPAVSAWELHQAWPGSELVMVPDAGHSLEEPGILEALVAATDRFADR